MAPDAAGPGTDPARGRHHDLSGDRPEGTGKNVLQPWKTEKFCIPTGERHRFVAGMEAVLAEYTRPDPDACPLIGMDEAAPEVVAGAFDPVPGRPGAARREDYPYWRLGTRFLFLFVRPFAGWRCGSTGR